MTQPTDDRIKRLEEGQKRLEEEVRRLKEQRTEEIKAIRVDVASADVEHRLDNHTELLREISHKQDTQEKQLTSISTDINELKLDAKAYVGDAAIFKNKVERMEIDVSTLKTDIEQVKTVQSGHSKFFEEHGKRLAATATKDDIRRLEATQEQILKLLQQKPGQ